MASGDPVVQILKIMPPGSDAALQDVRVGGSTPPESVLVYDFPDDASVYMDFLAKLEGYSGGGLTFTQVWSATTATEGDVRWELAIRRMNDDAEDIDDAHAYAYNGVTDTAPDVSGEVSYCAIAFTDGADMDNWADGEVAIIRIYRDHDHEDDDMAGDAELWYPPLGLET